MQKMYRYLVLLVFFICPVFAMADTVDPTVGSVAVPDRSQQALFKAAPAALRQVFIKVSGNPEVMHNPAVQSALSQAGQLIQTFSYTTQPAGNAQQLMVNIHFDQAVLNKLLRQANQVVLHASNRPMILAWINVNQDTNNPNTVLSSDESSPMIAALHGDAQRFGLPLILPAMDLQDQAYVNDRAELPFDTQKLAQAAGRYHVSSILAGNMSRAVDGSWQGQWLLIVNQQPHQWNTAGATAQAVASAALQDVNSMLSTSSTVSAVHQATLQSAVTVQVSGVNTLDDYALVLDDFKQLPVVAHMGVAQLNGATMSLQLNVVGGKEALQAALQRNSNFTSVAAMAEGQSDLYYQFQTADTDLNNSSVSS